MLLLCLEFLPPKQSDLSLVLNTLRRYQLFSLNKPHHFIYQLLLNLVLSQLCPVIAQLVSSNTKSFPSLPPCVLCVVSPFGLKPQAALTI